MAELQRDREYAAKLRKKLRAGKDLTDEQQKWIDAYETRTTITKAKAGRALPSGSKHTPTGAPKMEFGEFIKPSTLPDAARVVVDKFTVEPREQLALPGTVQTTVPVEGNVSPEEATWMPTVPPAVESAEPPPPGAPPPPTEGTPLVDEAPAASSPGDPAAAEQFAGLVVLVCGVGIASTIELLDGADLPIPPQWRTLLESEALHAKTLAHIGGAAQRVAIKYGFRSIPMADEAVVVGALAGSVAAFLAVQKRGKKPTTAAPAAAPVEATATPKRDEKPRPAPPADLARFLE